MVIYNNDGYGVIIYQESYLTEEQLKNSIPITEDEVENIDFTKNIKTDGKTWWLEDKPAFIESTIEIVEPIETTEDKILDLQEIIVEQQYDIELLKLGVSE